MKKVDKENKDKIMERIERAGDAENYETSWDEKGMPVSKEKTEMKKGRISKARGARFELKVRADLESKGRVVDKWSNNVDLEKKEVIPVKRLFKKFSLGIGHYRGVFVSRKNSLGIYYNSKGNSVFALYHHHNIRYRNQDLLVRFL